MDGIVKQISDALERIFRYVLPGACIVLALYLSHARWYSKIRIDQWQHVFLLATVAMCAGNVWYVFHRYSVHQFIDWIAYLILNRNKRGYRKWLVLHIADSFRAFERRPHLRRQLEFRSAHVISCLY